MLWHRIFPRIYEDVVLDAVLPFVKLAVPAAERLFNEVREILRQQLAQARTEAEVAELLAVGKPQAKAWLLRLMEERVVEKLAKPVRYRVTLGAERLPE